MLRQPGGSPASWNSRAVATAALERRGLAPRLKRFVCARQGIIEICLRGVRQLADDFIGRRIDDALLAAAVAFEKLAVDIEAQVFVHGESGGRSESQMIPETASAGSLLPRVGCTFRGWSAAPTTFVASSSVALMAARPHFADST